MKRKFKEICTGDIYGNWLVLDENDIQQKKGYKKVLCQCQCINKTIKYVDERNLVRGATVSCGMCSRKPIKIGDKFGEWTAIEDETQTLMILCQCSCGEIRPVNKTNLIKGGSISCGCVQQGKHFARNQYSDIGEDIIIGNKYHKWTVLEQVRTNSYLCECSCFNHTKRILKRFELLSDSNHDGCKKCRLMKNHLGEQYGYLKILSIDEERSKEKGRIYVYAQCKCGSVRSYEQNSIIKGRTVSCGCKKHEFDTELTGKRFGHLTVIELLGRKYIDENKSRNSYIEWKCKCDCGSTVVVRQGNLLKGGTWSCGCMKRSHGEELIFKYLKKNNFIFEEQYRIDECRNILPLPFDFALFNPNQKLVGLIEFDGQQHFTPFRFNECDDATAIQNFNECVLRDIIKTDYCKEKHIPFLRITYEDLEDNEWLYKLFDFLCRIKLIIEIKEIA